MYDKKLALAGANVKWDNGKTPLHLVRDRLMNLFEVCTVNKLNAELGVALSLVILSSIFVPSMANGLDTADAGVKAEAPLISLNKSDISKLDKGNVVIGNQPKANGRRWVTAKVKIKAHPSVVWEAVHEERKTDPDLAYSKVIEENKNEKTLEQKFQLLPIVGTSVCVIKSTEIPNKRIDYYLLKSDRFKAVEGSWILQPTDDGGTILELGSYIDIGVPAPRSIVENIAGKKLERRVSNVRKFAESGGKALAHKGSGN